MALSFPTSLNNFFGSLPIKSARPDLTESVEINQNGYGELITANLGMRLWEMSITLRNGDYHEMEAHRARINVFRQAGRPFLVHAIPSKFPRYDPTGGILGATLPTLQTVNGNQRDIILAGLPNGYKLYPGDCISFEYGSNPVRYAFHQIVSGPVTANGSGVTPVFEVVPNLRPGYALDSDVRLISPRFKAIIKPGSVNMGSSESQRTDGISFSVIQTLRN